MEPIRKIPLLEGRVETWSSGCEQYATYLVYNMAPILEKWPDAVPSVAFTRADDESYAHIYMIEDQQLLIPLMLADTEMPGRCKCMVTMTDVGGRTNSTIYHGNVLQGIDTLGEEPSDPQLGIIEQVNGAVVRAENAAEIATGTVAGLDETTESKKAEIVETAEEQMDRLKSSEGVEGLVKDAIAGYFDGNEITAESIGAASAEALNQHKQDENNPHKVTAEQVGAAEKAHASQHSASGDDPVTPEMIGAMPADYTPPVLSVNGKTGEVSLSYSDVGASPSDHTHTAVQVGAAPATEDATYKGCFYRMVNGEKEWINPPLVLGEEYRTAERWDGNAVYVKNIDLGLSADQKEVAYNVSFKARLLSVEVMIGTFPASQRPAGASATGSGYYCEYYVTGANVKMFVGTSMVNVASYAKICFTKEGK